MKVINFLFGAFIFVIIFFSFTHDEEAAKSRNMEKSREVFHSGLNKDR